MMNRRKFSKIALLGSASAVTSSGIFFPKPVEALTFNFSISNARIQTIFGDLVRLIAARVVERIEQDQLEQSVRNVNQILTQQGFTRYQTPYARRVRTASSAPIWGRERPDIVAPNPGIATVQRVNDWESQATFTGPTSVGIKTAASYLASERLSPDEIDGSLIPVESKFEDYATWLGDDDPTIGSSRSVGLTNYKTRLGQVMRRYDAIDPNTPNIGRVRMIIEAANQPRRVITTNIIRPRA